MEVETTPPRPNNARRKRRMHNEDEMMFRSSKRRLTQAMDGLHLGSTTPRTPEWGSPFGQRTRLRVSKRPPIVVKGEEALAFGDSFKRALDVEGVTDSVAAPGPTKRRRNNDSRALVLYRAPTTAANLLRPNHQPWTQRYPTIPREAVTPVVELVEDENEEVKDIVSTDDDSVMEIVIGEEGASELTKGALVKVPSLVQRRRAAFAEAAQKAGSLVHAQTAILMPWHERKEDVDVDGDVDMA